MDTVTQDYVVLQTTEKAKFHGKQTPQESWAQGLAAACAVVQPGAFAMYVSELNTSYSGQRETFPDSKQCSQLQCHMKNFK